ncbi:YheC/YheD family protein [Alkalihalobacillus sp. MEB130]|uniref:YheC/YheD family protein n=1 Tax=Alkalihalobacillus sp. MEB130 TaxID=2976704 RepID=UPI0028E02B44|nr:YheC/YheD family protein [Alkalihalobacillus sp. MEB130]MDT8861974.1 YheC/YheD family protein [Alkalihalobacillus sp. MEB130]
MSFITVKSIKSSSRSLRIHPVLAEKIGINKRRKKIDICYGNRQYEATMSITKKVSKDVIELDQSSMEKLMIDPCYRYNCQYKDGNVLIGPLIGLLYSHKTRYLKKRFSNEEKKKRYEAYAQMMQKIGGVIYAFATDQIDYEKEEVKGFVYNESTSTWEEKVFPLPGVIYRKVSVTEELEKKMKGKIVNSYRFTKYEFWEMLKDHYKIAKHLPETTNEITKSKLDDLLGKYDKVILKHTKKKLGYGIYLITKEKDHYHITKNLTYDSFSISNDEMVEFLEKHQEDYIIQQFVSLKMYENRKIDYRLIFTKTVEEKWECKGILGWLGAVGGFTIHTLVETNGRTLEEMLKMQFDYTPKQIAKKKKEMIKIGNDIAWALDTIERPYIDFGFDFGLDESGKVWVFEANVYQQLWSPLYLDDYDMYEQIIECVIKYLEKEAMS